MVVMVVVVVAGVGWGDGGGGVFEAIILKQSTSNVDTESDSSLDGFIITINFAKFSSVTAGSIPTNKITKVSKLT